jgi:hypothetical protein
VDTRDYASAVSWRRSDEQWHRQLHLSWGAEGLIAAALFVLMAMALTFSCVQSMLEYRHGYHGTFIPDQCDDFSVCTGSFDGDDGGHIADVTLEKRQRTPEPARGYLTSRHGKTVYPEPGVKQILYGSGVVLCLALTVVAVRWGQQEFEIANPPERVRDFDADDPASTPPAPGQRTRSKLRRRRVRRNRRRP